MASPDLEAIRMPPWIDGPLPRPRARAALSATGGQLLDGRLVLEDLGIVASGYARELDEDADRGRVPDYLAYADGVRIAVGAIART